MKKALFLLTIIASISLFGQGTCNPVVFTYSSNAFGVGGGISTYKQNCLSYNADLNAVIWTHRASPLWGFSGYTSGAVQCTWLNVATGIWDSTILYRDSANLHKARYPGGIFFNPVGNTNISNAFVVGTGPSVSSAWDGTWYSSRQITGNYHLVHSTLDNNMFCLSGSAPFGNINLSNGSGFLNNDIQQVGNTIFVGSGLSDATYTSTGITNDIHGGVVGKATNLSWSADSIIPGFYVSSAGGYANDAQGVRLAFSPNGQIGYAVFVGRLATSFGNNADSTLSPIVYKTTNGGTTWSSSPVLPGFDWPLGHPELMKNVGKLRGYQARHSKLFLKHGIDLTVDSLGTLHLVGTMTDPFIGTGPTWSVDSLTYGYTYQWDYRNNHPVIWDLMTNGANWDVLMVDSIMTGEVGPDPSVDTTAVASPWDIGGTGLAYGARIQVGRSSTGGKIFYSWADSDTNVTHELRNIAPDIHMKSYDISNQMVTPSVNMTQGLQKCFFHYISQEAYYDNSQNGWICPIVYATGHDSIQPPYNGNGTVDYNYFNCALFTNTQYTDSASLYRTQNGVGLNTITGLPYSVIQNFPNPFSQLTNIKVTLKRSEEIGLKVYDVLGSQVYSTLKKGVAGTNDLVFDGSSLRAGVYYYTLTVKGESFTGKMILQK